MYEGFLLATVLFKFCKNPIFTNSWIFLTVHLLREVYRLGSLPFSLPWSIYILAAIWGGLSFFRKIDVSECRGGCGSGSDTSNKRMPFLILLVKVQFFSCLLTNYFRSYKEEEYYDEKKYKIVFFCFWINYCWITFNFSMLSAVGRIRIR